MQDLGQIVSLRQLRAAFERAAKRDDGSAVALGLAVSEIERLRRKCGESLK